MALVIEAFSLGPSGCGSGGKIGPTSRGGTICLRALDLNAFVQSQLSTPGEPT